MPLSATPRSFRARLATAALRVAVPFAAAASGWLAAEYALAAFGGRMPVRFAFLAGSLGASVALAIAWTFYERRWRLRVERLQGLLRTDPATGALNRRGFEIELQRMGAFAKRSRHSLCLMRVSVDQAAAFKQLPAEQRREVSATIANMLVQGRRGEDAVARLGAFDYAVLMPRADVHGGQRVAERIRETFRRTAFLAKGAGRVTVSIGLADLAAKEPLSLLVRMADKALAQARRIGNTIVAAEPPSPAAYAPAESEPLLFGWNAAQLEDRPDPEEDITDEAEAIFQQR